MYNMTPAEVAQAIMDGESLERGIDYLTWKSATIEARAEAFDEILSILINYKYDPEFTLFANNSERLSMVTQYFEEYLTHWANKESIARGIIFKKDEGL